jgi:hypothetical protein
MKLTIRDYTTYKSATSRNGGDYGFEETALLDDRGRIESGSYWTTADFAYCPCCGTFEQRMDEHVERQHGGNENDYQPSDAMLMAQKLALLSSPMDDYLWAKQKFAQWTDVPTLEIEDA